MQLAITSTPNQDNPLMEGAEGDKMIPFLGLDVWEHAYVSVRFALVVSHMFISGRRHFSMFFACLDVFPFFMYTAVFTAQCMCAVFFCSCRCIRFMQCLNFDVFFSLPDTQICSTLLSLPSSTSCRTLSVLPPSSIQSLLTPPFPFPLPP